MSLYIDYNPRTTIRGTGYKDKYKARQTIKLLHGQPMNRQIWTITGLYYRAKYHPYQTDEMEDAMNIFRCWLKKHVGTCPSNQKSNRKRRKSTRRKSTRRKSTRKKSTRKKSTRKKRSSTRKKRSSTRRKSRRPRKK